MQLTFKEKIRLKLIFTSCKGMGLEYIAGHLVAPAYIGSESAIVDLGGNQGVFSQEMVKRYRCACYCVEPDPRLFESIPVNESIRKYNVAITDTDGQMNFILSSNSESNSFNPIIASLWGRDKVISVQTRSLQSLQKEISVPNIDLLKIDIEGSEIPLLASLTDEELLKIPQLTVEFHEFLDASLERDTMQAIRRMQTLGFLTIVYSAKKFSDVLFLNSRLTRLSWQQCCWYYLHRVVRHRGNPIL